MDTLQDAYRDEDDDVPAQPTTTIPSGNPDRNPVPDPLLNPTELPSEIPEPQPATEPNTDPKPEAELEPIAAVVSAELEELKPEPMPVDPVTGPEPESTAVEPVTEAEELIPESMAVELSDQPVGKAEVLGSEDVSSDSISEDENTTNADVPESSDKKEDETQEEDEIEEDPAAKKAKSDPAKAVANGNESIVKKSSKKKSKNSNSVWTKTTSRKGKKKAKNFNGGGNANHNAPLKAEDTVKITPLPRFPDKNDDSPEAKICLSKVYKAEKVEVSEDRMSAGSCKGYRMVRATRGVSEGSWFFEIKVVSLGETGHTRLGWSTEKGDLQAPVGYDGCSYGYRDVDGSKVHKALREKYGDEGYKEGDVIGCYISLPEGDSFAPKAPHLVWYKGQKYVCNNDSKEDTAKIVPGSEISFFKNGICQGVAFKDLSGGRYYPAASMYTLPDQPNCVVKFNFGPDFECFPADFEGRPTPRSMIEVPYHGYENQVENGVSDESKQ